MRDRLGQINEEVRATKSFAFDTNGYLREAAEQRARLSAVGLVKGHDHDGHHCPVCQSTLYVPVPIAAQLERSLESLSAQLEAVEAENPRLQVRLARLLEQKTRIEDELRENQQRISERIRENESLRAQQETFVQQARVGGKIIQYLDAHRTAAGTDAMRDAYRELRTRIEMLEAELDEETTREKLGTFLNIIGRYMTEYSDKLDLEHVGSQLRLPNSSTNPTAWTASAWHSHLRVLGKSRAQELSGQRRRTRCSNGRRRRQHEQKMQDQKHNNQREPDRQLPARYLKASGPFSSNASPPGCFEGRGHRHERHLGPRRDDGLVLTRSAAPPQRLISLSKMLHGEVEQRLSITVRPSNS